MKYKEPFDRSFKFWKSTFGEYSKRKADAERSVVRWEWTTGDRYSLLPFYFQRFPGRGRVLKEKPTAKGYYRYYGFDEMGRVWVKREYNFWETDYKGIIGKIIANMSQPGGLYSETFIVHGEDLSEIVEYSPPPHIPLKVQQIFFSDEKVELHTNFRINGYSPLYSRKGKDPEKFYQWLGPNGRFITIEQYMYVGDRLEAIAAYYETPGIQQPYTTRENFLYDENGHIIKIERVYEDNRREIVYQKRKKGQTFRSITEVAKSKLMQAIIEKLRDTNIREKIYCIELYYQRGLNHFPPAIIPIPESYRQELIESADPDARINIFIPVPDKTWFYEISDPDTLEICQILEQEIQAGEKWDAAVRILRDIAAALTHYDWSGILDITPDFVVFALDPEIDGSDMTSVLSSSVSKEQIREWKSKGWLD